MNQAILTYWTKFKGIESFFAYALIASCFLGIAPVNISLGFGALFVLVFLITKIHEKYDFSEHIWLWAVGFYLATRIIAVAFSPEPLISLRHFAKDWRLVALIWGATGVLAKRPKWILVVIIAMSINWLYGVLDMIPELIPDRFYEITSLNKRYGTQRMDSFFGLALTQGGVAMLVVFLPFLIQTKRIATILIVGMGLIMLALSATRGSQLALIVGAPFIFMGLKKVKWYGIVIPTILILIMVIAIPGVTGRVKNLSKDYSISHRFTLWEMSVEFGLSQPFGIGPGRFQREAMPLIERGSSAHAHNVPLHLFAEGGVLGLLGILIFFGGFLFELLRTKVKEKWLGVGLIATMFFGGLTELNFYDGEVAVLFFILLGHALWLVGRGLTPHEEVRPENV